MSRTWLLGLCAVDIDNERKKSDHPDVKPLIPHARDAGLAARRTTGDMVA
jgi:hypothetical protein